jgi:glycerate 2-kinase
MPLASDARAIARAGVRAVRPDAAVRRTVDRRGARIRVGARSIALGPGGRVAVVAIGKAAGAMADAAVDRLGPDVEGIVVTPRGYPAPRRRLELRFGEHPIPGAGSFRAGRALLDFVGRRAARDAILFLISGGGSAAAEAAAPGLSEAELARTTELLLGSGAPIGAMNAVRRHLSAIKGGRLALAAGPAPFATVALSDVVGDRPADIASGPTVGDPSTFRTARAVLREYALARRVPSAVAAHLRRGALGRLPETPRPSDPRLRRAPFVVAASNRTAREAARDAARRRGYRTQLLRTPIVGETRPAGVRFARALLRASATGRRVALVGGGETTVTLGPRPGRGGRNQEFAIAAARLLAGRAALVLSIGTDGIDGPTDAAGGWVDGRTVDRAARRGVDLDRALRRHATYAALERLGGLLRTGSTGTNVTDLHVGLAVTSARRGTGESSRRSAAPSSRRRRS